MLKTSITLAALAVVAVAGGAEARDRIRIVGSSTVYPFATTVAEAFGDSTKFKTPIVESTGSGGGFKLFCAGVGSKSPDITNASRRIKISEFKKCQRNGVKDLVEVRIGYDGIVFANSKAGPKLNLTRKQIFMALAKTVPMNGGWAANAAKTWKDVDPSLPNVAIEVLGPPPTSGTRDAFVELVMETACKQTAEAKALKKANGKTAMKAKCQAIREDGAFIEAGENDNLIVQKLEANKNAFGVFGYSYLEENTDKIQGALVDGEEPSFENIASGAYPVSRSLQFYVKKAHVDAIPGLREYLAEFTSEKAWGDDGYLADKGLIPMPAKERARFAEVAAELKTMTAGDI